MRYEMWPPYVTVAERAKKTQKLADKAAKLGLSLDPIASFTGAIAKSFWGKAWCNNLERYSDYSNRLPRGRSYVKNGAVIDLKVLPRSIEAKVAGSSLYSVKINIEAVPIPEWTSICSDCSNSIDSLVELLQGKLSSAVMERICAPGKGLFPAPKSIRFACSCPDGARMCKHVAAAFYGVGKRLDQEPHLLFTLRAVDVKDLITEQALDNSTDPQTASSMQILDDSMLSDVFGIEMASSDLSEVLSETSISMARKKSGRPAKSREALNTANSLKTTQSAKTAKTAKTEKAPKKTHQTKDGTQKSLAKDKAPRASEAKIKISKSTKKIKAVPSKSSTSTKTAAPSRGNKLQR